jgi:uncharacterized protein YhaN
MRLTSSAAREQKAKAQAQAEAEAAAEAEAELRDKPRLLSTTTDHLRRSDRRTASASSNEASQNRDLHRQSRGVQQPRKELTEFDKLIRENNRDRRRGIGAGAAERALAMLQGDNGEVDDPSLSRASFSPRSTSSSDKERKDRTRRENPYPTPDSRRSTSHDDGTATPRQAVIDFDMLQNNSEVDQGLLQDAKNALLRRQEAGHAKMAGQPDWDGFWTDAQVGAYPATTGDVAAIRI